MRPTDELDGNATDPSAMGSVIDPTVEDDEEEDGEDEDDEPPTTPSPARSMTRRGTSVTTARCAMGAAGSRRATSMPSSVPPACPASPAAARVVKRAAAPSPGPVRVAWGAA